MSVIYFIKNDSDNYVNSFTEYDLIARKCSSKIDYINKCLQDFALTLEEKKMCQDRIEKVLDKANVNLTKLSVDFSSIDWKFMLFRGDYYENSLSHTRFNTIFLPLRVFREYTDKELVRLLCHEKIHLFQKVYPTHPLIIKFMSNYNIVDIPVNIKNMIRANPDTNRKVYVDKKGNMLCYIYSSMKPTCINDVKKFSMYEHPFEQMAVEWSKL